MKFFLFFSIVIFAFVGCSKPGAEEMFNKAVDAQKSDQYDAAIASFEELIKAYPDSSQSPKALYAIGAIYQNDKHSYHEAIQSFRRLVEKYPNHATASNASFLIGFIYNNDIKNIDSARIAYEDFLQRYPADHLVDPVKFELSNLGKDPEEILKARTLEAQGETKPSKKTKK
jgi:TolA-binding protein